MRFETFNQRQALRHELISKAIEKGDSRLDLF